MRFSYSKLSTYRRCPRQYNWYYIQKIKINQSNTIETLRGLALHEYAENSELDSKIDYRIFIENFEVTYDSRLPRKIKKTMEIGKNRIHQFYKEYIKLVQEKGYQLFLEQKFIVNFYKHLYVAKIDILLLKENSAIIIDYKTGRNSETTYYKEQLSLYKMAVTLICNIPPENIETYICFLLAPMEIENVNNFLQPVPLSAEEYESYQKKAMDTLTEIEISPKKNPCLNNMCRFCPYRKSCELAIICAI